MSLNDALANVQKARKKKEDEERRQTQTPRRSEKIGTTGDPDHDRQALLTYQGYTGDADHDRQVRALRGLRKESAWDVYREGDAAAQTKIDRNKIRTRYRRSAGGVDTKGYEEAQAFYDKMYRAGRELEDPDLVHAAKTAGILADVERRQAWTTAEKNVQYQHGQQRNPHEAGTYESLRRTGSDTQAMQDFYRRMYASAAQTGDREGMEQARTGFTAAARRLGEETDAARTRYRDFAAERPYAAQSAFRTESTGREGDEPVSLANRSQAAKEAAYQRGLERQVIGQMTGDKKLAQSGARDAKEAHDVWRAGERGRAIDQTAKRIDQERRFAGTVLSIMPGAEQIGVDIVNGTVNAGAEIVGGLQQFRQKAELENLKKSNLPQYYALTMSPEEIEEARTHAENQLAQARGRQQNAEQALKNYQSTMSDVPEGYQPTAQDMKWNAQIGEAEGEVKRYEQAAVYQKMIRLNQMAMNVMQDPAFEEKAAEGKRKFSEKNQQAYTDFLSGDAEFQRAIQRWANRDAYTEQEKLDKDIQDPSLGEYGYDLLGYLGYNRDLDDAPPPQDPAGITRPEFSNLTENQKKVYYAMYLSDPAGAHDYVEMCRENNVDAHYAAIKERAADDKLGSFFKGVGANLMAGLAASAFTAGSSDAERWGRTAKAYQEGGMEGLSDGWRFAYSTGQSMLQSVLTELPALAANLVAPGSGLVTALGGVGLGIQGGSAAASDFVDKIDQGWSRDAAEAHAIFAGVAEIAFEKISLDRLIQPSVAKNILYRLNTQGLVEASEEGFTNLANRISDTAISRLADYDTEIEYNTKQRMIAGESYTDARNHAIIDSQSELFMDALGGYASGFLMGGGYAALDRLTTKNTKNARSYYQDLGGSVARTDGSIDALLQFAKANNIDTNVSDVSGLDLSKRKARENNIEVGELAHTVSQQIAKSMKEANGIDGAVRVYEDTVRQFGEGIRPVAEQTLDSMVSGQITNEIRGTNGINGAAQAYVDLVEQYGDAIRPVAEEALRQTVNQKISDTADNVDSILSIFDETVKGIENEEARQIVQDAMDFQVFKAGMQAQADMANEEMTKNASAVTEETGETGPSAALRTTETESRGEIIQADKLTADADTADMIGLMLKSGMSEEASKAMIRNFEAQKAAGLISDPYRWGVEYVSSFDRGRTGKFTLEQAQKQAKAVAPELVQTAYEAGRKAGEALTQAQREKLNTALAIREKGATGRAGSVDVGELAAKIEKDTGLRNEVERIRKFAETFGVDVGLFESGVKNGRYQGENGRYSDGRIWLDINAGRNKVGDVSRGMVQTMAHEMTHFMQDYNPEGYSSVRQYSLSQIVAQKGENTLDALIREKQKRHTGDKPLSRTKAEDEVVADFCEDMLTDKAALETMAKEDPKGFQALVEWVKDFLQKVKDKLAGRPAGSYEVQVYRALEQKARDAFGEAWGKGIVGAVQTHDVVGSIKNTADAQNSDRDAEYLELAKDPQKNAARLQEMVDEAAKEAGYTVKAYHGTPYARSEVNPNYEKAVIQLYSIIHPSENPLQQPGDYGTDSYKRFWEFAGPINRRWLWRASKYYNIPENIKVILAQGSVRNFTVFKTDELGFHSKSSNEKEIGAYFTPDKLAASTFTEHVEVDMFGNHRKLTTGDGYVYSVYINPSNVVQRKSPGKANGKKFAEIIVKNPADIKSADPVTYDDAGNVIPLSERFDTEKEDIRYQMREYDQPSDLELMEGIDPASAENVEQGRLLREYQAAGKKLTELQRRYEKLQDEMRGMEGENPSRISVKDFKRNVLDLFGIPAGKRTEIGSLLQSVAEGVLSGQKLSPNDVSFFFQQLVLAGQQKSMTDEYYSGIREDLKGRRIYVNEQTRADFGDDWNAFRKRAFGLGIRLTSNENDMGVDSVQAELAENFPGSFDAGELDMRTMLENMVDTAEAGRTTDVSLLESMEQIEKQTGEPVREQLQGLMDQFTRAISIMEDRARLEAKARADNAAEIVKAKNRAEKARAELSRIRKERNDWKRKATAADAKAARRLDAELRKVVQHDAKQLAEAVRQKESLARKLEKQIQREKDIMEGKLRTPQLAKMLKDAREASAKEMAKHKDEVFARAKERRDQGRLRERISNLKKDLQQRLSKPTDGRYVPAGLAKSLIDVLDTIDNSPKAGTKAAERAVTVSERLRALADAYEGIKNDPNVGWEYQSEYDEEIRDQIKALSDTMQGRNLRDLTSAELQQVYDQVRQVRDIIRDAAKTMSGIEYGSLYDAMYAVANQQGSMKSLNSLSLFRKKKRMRLLDNLSVMRAVEMMSGWDRSAALYQLMRAVEDGVVDSDRWMMNYNKSLQDLKTGKNEKAYRDALTKKLDYGVTDEEGAKVLMTKLQALQLLMTAEREAANPDLVHLQKGGAVIRDALAIQDGKAAKAKSQTIQVTPELIQKIRDGLTAWDKSYMDAIHKYFAKEAKATNGILYRLKHRVLQAEDAYVPYIVDQNYLDAKLDEQGAMTMWVRSPGSTNALKIQSPKPVIIDGMDTVMAKHVKEIADYIGLAIPIRDFSKVYNGRLQSRDANPVPVKKTIDRTFGGKGQHLLTQAIIDVQGGGKRGGWSTAIAERLNWLQSAFVKSALLINPSVTIKQAASYTAAESILSHAALIAGNRPTVFGVDKSRSPSLIAQIFAAPEGRTAQRIYNEIDRYTSMHYQRRQGMSQAELANEANRSGKVKRWMNGIGASMEQSKLGHAARKVGEALNPVSWIQRMDVATTAALWVACKEQAKMDGKKVGSDEYWQRTTELYERCLRETQPMYDGLHRSANQKQHEGIMQYLFPFRTVPIQNHGQITASYEGLLAAKESGDKARMKEAGKFFRKTVWAQTESAVVFSVMTFLAAMLKRKTKKYRDEDEEADLWSVLQGIGMDTASTWFSDLFPVFGSELWSIGDRITNKLTGKNAYSFDAFSVGAVDLLNSLAESGDKLFADAGKLMRGEEVPLSTIGQHGLSMALKAAKLAGVPAETVKTYWDGMMGNIRDLSEGKLPALNDDAVERKNAVNASRYWKAWTSGDDEKMAAVIEEMRQNYLDDGKDPEKADELTRNALSGAAVDRYEAGEMDLDELAEYMKGTGLWDEEKLQNKLAGIIRDDYKAGLRSQEETIDALVRLGGFDEDKAWKKANEWESRNAHAEDEEYSYSQYEDFYAALDGGGSFDEAAAPYLEHGYEEKNLQDAAVAHVKERYNAGALSEEKAIELLKQYKGLDEDDAWWKVEEWRETAEHDGEKDYKWSRYNGVKDAMFAGEDISSELQRLEDHGIKFKDANSQVKEKIIGKELSEGRIDEDRAEALLLRYWQVKDEKTKQYRAATADEVYWAVDEWSEKNAHKDEDEFSYTRYDDVFAGIDAGENVGAAVKDLQAHGVSQDAIRDAISGHIKEAFDDGTISKAQAQERLGRYWQVKDEKTKQYRSATKDEVWWKVDEWSKNKEHADDETYTYNKYNDVFALIDAGKDIGSAVKVLKDHGVSGESVDKAAKDHILDEFEAGRLTEKQAVQKLQKYRGLSADDAYWEVDKRRSKAAAEKAGQEFNDSNYRDLYAAIDSNKDSSYKAAMKELTDHGYKERTIYDAAKDYLVDKFEKGQITERALKEMLSRYAKIVNVETVDGIVNNAKCYKETGYRLGSLDTSFIDGEITADKAKNLLVKYDGKSETTAAQTVRYWQVKKDHPEIKIDNDHVNSYYDGTKTSQENKHETASAAGVSITLYAKVKPELGKISGTDYDGNGKSDTYSQEANRIAYIDALNISDREKRALYFEYYTANHFSGKKAIKRPKWLNGY